MDACGAVVGVDIEAREDRLIEGLARSLTGEPVDAVGPVEQFQDGPDGVRAGVKIGALRLGDLVFKPCAFVADLTKAISDLVLGPVGIADEVEVLIFLGAQLADLLLDAVSEFGIGRRGGAESGVHTLVDTFAQVGGERHGGVVVRDHLFDLGDRQIGEVARVVLAASADVVEVQVTAPVLAAHDHEASLAALTPHGAFEVVVVLPIAPPSTPFAVEDLLYAIEQYLVDQGLVAALVFDALEVDVAEVIAVA